MRKQACTARIPANRRLAPLTIPHVEGASSAHGQMDEVKDPDVGGLGALVTAIVVLGTCVLLPVLTAVLMLVS